MKSLWTHTLGAKIALLALVYDLAATLLGAVYAQVPADAGTGQTTLLSALIAGFATMTGLMVWIIRKMLDKTIPDMQATFQAALDKQQTGYQQSFERATENFHRDHDREQAAFTRTIDMLCAELRRISETFAAKEQSERDFYGQMTRELLESLKISQEAINTLLSGKAT